MTAMLVETECKTTIQTVVDGSLSNSALISLLPCGPGSDGVNLVIGAYNENRYRSHFCAASLGKLIEELSKVHKALEEMS